MISWSDVNSMQKQKLNLQLELNDILNSGNRSYDKENELKAEIKHLENQINRILGSNEVKRQEQLRKQKSGIDERNAKSYFALKTKYKKISYLRISTSRLLSVIQRTRENREEHQDVLVRVR